MAVCFRMWHSGNRNKIRALAQGTKCYSLNALIPLRQLLNALVETDSYTIHGLPVGMTKEHYESVTGKKIEQYPTLRVS